MLNSTEMMKQLLHSLIRLENAELDTDPWAGFSDSDSDIDGSFDEVVEMKDDEDLESFCSSACSASITLKVFSRGCFLIFEPFISDMNRNYWMVRRDT